MKTFLTSDQHFGHKNIIKYCNRPYEDVHTMNKALTENWNSVVSPEDTVYHLGDFAFGGAHKYLPHLNGNIILIRGNHDRKKDFKEFESYWAKDFEYGGYRFRLNHRPIFTGNIDDPYNDNETNNRINLDDYDYVLCGHVHEKWLRLEKNINLSCDVWDYRPISIEELIEFIEEENKIEIIS